MLDEAYPAQYESRTKLRDGREVFFRPIRKTDGDLLLDLLSKLSFESVRLRFMMPLRTLSNDKLIQLTHVNYNTEFALVAVIPEDGKDAIIAVGRYAFEPQFNATDFAVVVRDDWQNNGLGRFLLGKIFQIGKEHGISRFVGMIDPDNKVMKKILFELGHTVKSSFKNGTHEFEVLV